MKLSPDDVKAVRKHLSLTQQQMSEVFGIAVATVSRWETGYMHPTGTMEMILKHLLFKANKKRAEKADTEDTIQVIMMQKLLHLLGKG